MVEKNCLAAALANIKAIPFTSARIAFQDMTTAWAYRVGGVVLIGTENGSTVAAGACTMAVAPRTGCGPVEKVAGDVRQAALTRSFGILFIETVSFDRLVAADYGVKAIAHEIRELLHGAASTKEGLARRAILKWWCLSSYNLDIVGQLLEFDYC